MPTTGAPGNVWYPDDTAPVAPLENLFLQQATSVNVALSSLFGPALTLNVADLAALPAAAGYPEGRRIHVDALNVDFVQTDGVWVQEGVARVATASARDTEYAKASAAYRVQGVQVYRTDVGWIETYLAAYNSGTNARGAQVAGAGAAGWYPLPGQGPRAVVKRVAAQSLASAAFTVLTWDTAYINTHAMWVSASNPARITVPVAGDYRIGVGIAINVNAPARSMIMLRRNGASINAGVGGMYLSATEAAASGSVIVRCAANDYLEASIWQDTGSPQNSSVAAFGVPHFDVDYVGPPIGPAATAM